VRTNGVITLKGVEVRRRLQVLKAFIELLREEPCAGLLKRGSTTGLLRKKKPPNLLGTSHHHQNGRRGRNLEVQQLKVEGLGGLVGKEGPHAHQASLLPLRPFRAGHIDLSHPCRKNLNHQKIPPVNLSVSIN
jgi:hypothetical protein